MFIKNWFYIKKDAAGIRKDTIKDPTDTYVNIVYEGSPNSGNIMSVSDFAAQSRPYKVYTALLTQSGGDVVESIQSSPLVIGTTYTINDYIPNDDFKNVGAPSNQNGVSFVATGTTPNNWSEASELTYNTGAPVVTVLENTIGNVWFTYNVAGEYFLNTNGGLTVAKTIALITPNFSTGYNAIGVGYGNSDFLGITTISLGDSILPQNNALYNTPIEIRVYN